MTANEHKQKQRPGLAAVLMAGLICALSMPHGQPDAAAEALLDDNTEQRWSRVDSPNPSLRAGDADQDLNFHQLDLVQVQMAAKYLTGQAAIWGEVDLVYVPEPTSGLLLAIGLMVGLFRFRCNDG